MPRPKGSKNEGNIMQNKGQEPEFDVMHEEASEIYVKSSEADLEVIQQEIDQARVELQKTKLEIEAKQHELKTMNVSQEKAVVKDAPVVQMKNQASAEKIAAQKAYDNQMVTGKFSNLRAPGQPVKLPYHKYADDPVKWWPFEHGKIYTIPRGFADQINGGDDTNPCYYTPRFIKKEGAEAIISDLNPDTGIHGVDTSNKKYMFSPVNF